MTENLNDVMRGATENLHPNIGMLTAGGIARGVRKRRNRRFMQIAGATASVSAVFGVVAVVGVSGTGASARVSAASGSQGSPGSPVGGAAAPAPTSTPLDRNTEAASGPGKPAAGPVTGDQMATWLQQALQPYRFTGEQVLDKQGSDGPAGPYATLRIGYDGQAGSVSLNVEHAAYQGNQQLPPYMSVSTLPDGSHLEVFNGPEWPAGNGDPKAKRLEVTWYRTDGAAVDVQVLNAVQEKGTTTATGLGLTEDQAAKVVQSPVWNKAIAAVLARTVPSNPSMPSGEKSKLLQQKNPGGGSGTDTSPAVPPAQ